MASDLCGGLRRKTAVAKRARTIDEYLTGLDTESRAALQKVRRAIHAAAPKAEECISYQLPAFRLDGKVLVMFGAAANHCSFFPGSGTAVEAHKAELKGYETSKGTVHFQPEKPLPASLVRKIVKYRIAENAASRADRDAKRKKRAE